MPDGARRRYLGDLDAVLPIPAAERADVVAEIATHLDDAVAERVERGVDPALAEADAQARLGPPNALARSLVSDERSAWRSFAGVGEALWSGTGHWIYGYLFGTLVVVVAALAMAALVQAVGMLLRTGWTLQTDDMGWNSMLVAVAIGVGCYFAGRVLPDRFARRSRHLATDARPWVVAASAPLVGFITIFLVDVAQNWASVAAFALAPLGIVLGAYRPNLLPGRVRLGLVTIVVGLLLLAISAAAIAGRLSSSSAIASGYPVDSGLSVVGPTWHPGSDPQAPAMDSTSWGETDGGAIHWEGDLASGVPLDRFSDVRLEAWRTTDQWLSIDPRYGAPFAIAPATREGSTVSADIVTTGVPGVTRWTLILTGVDGDGTRWVIDASSGGQSTFTGSVWDWIVAVAAGE